jgi:transposase
MRARLFWLNDKQWACIAPHPPTNLTGPERDDDRRIISGIIHMLQVRRPLARLPARVWSLHNHHNRFNRAKHGRWGANFESNGGSAANL